MHVHVWGMVHVWYSVCVCVGECMHVACVRGGGGDLFLTSHVSRCMKKSRDLKKVKLISYLFSFISATLLAIRFPKA